MEVATSALKHGVEVRDIVHAWENALRLVEYEYDGEKRLLVIGPARDSTFLELVAVLAGVPIYIIHADLLLPMFYEYLR